MMLRSGLYGTYNHLVQDLSFLIVPKPFTQHYITVCHSETLTTIVHHFSGKIMI